MSTAKKKIEKKAPVKKVATKKVSTKEAAVKKVPDKKKWFVIHARSGYEAKVKVAIEEAVSREGIEDLISEIMIPTEQVVELKGGKKKETERKFFPGYMLIKMELTEPSWLLVKNTNNVIGFIGGSSGKPSPKRKERLTEFLHVFKKELINLNRKWHSSQVKRSWLLVVHLMSLMVVLKVLIMKKVC